MKNKMSLYFLSAFAVLLFQSSLYAFPDKKTFGGCKAYPAHYDSINNCYLLRNEQTKFRRKFLRGSVEVVGYNTLSMALLFALPQNVSMWHKPDVKSVNAQYRRSFTHIPVYDPDPWYINYIGHPYAGSCYYNSVRSQGAKFWQAILFTTGHSIVWEYLTEGGLEQPSIQDLVVTPVVGSILGELFHHATIKMSRNGFRWYEKIFVCVFNPMFAINNGFRYANNYQHFP